MSLVNFTSGINKIEELMPLSEWATKFIIKENLTRENHSNCESFRILPRRQKDAVRYQLRKITNRTNREPSRKPFALSGMKSNFVPLRKLKMALSIWISCFLLVDIVQIYSDKGLSPFLAWQTAILVELCIVVGSLCKERRIQRTAYAFLVYNICLFAFSEVHEVVKKRELNATISNSIKEKLNLKNNLAAELEEASKFYKQSQNVLSKFIGKGFISSATQAATKLDTNFSRKEQRTITSLDNINEELKDLEMQRNNLFLVGVVSLLYFLLRCVLQVFSIWLLTAIRREGHTI